ncbi:hypothetical protein ACLB2K_019512 [Fragaria x ananassa]
MKNQRRWVEEDEKLRKRLLELKSIRETELMEAQLRGRLKIAAKNESISPEEAEEREKMRRVVESIRKTKLMNQEFLKGMLEIAKNAPPDQTPEEARLERMLLARFFPDAPGI